MTIEDDRRQAQLEAEAKRRGLTPTEVAMARAVPTDLIGAIVRDNQRNVHDRPGHPEPKPRVGNGGGWVEPPKVDNWRPPGLDIMDRMMDAQDAQDRQRRKGGE